MENNPGCGQRFMRLWFLFHKKLICSFRIFAPVLTKLSVMNFSLKKIWDFISIITVFALTGLSTAYLSGIIMTAIGAEAWTFKFISGYLLLIFPLYQFLTLVYAFLFGKFRWFYSRQKKIFMRIISLFTKIRKGLSPAEAEKT